MNKIEGICRFINSKTNEFKPEIGIILGSGLGIITKGLFDEDVVHFSIDYSDIPGFPVSTIKGHEGKLVFGKIHSRNVMIMQGRFHYYEGYSAEDIVISIRVMKELGISKLIITNAAGAVNRKFTPGEFMLISDHINLTGINPLRGANDDNTGPRFPDMTDCYDKEIRKKIIIAAEKNRIRLKEGVYMYFTGPNYETKSEIKAAKVLGADAIGMSTVPEVIAAVHCGMKVTGISCITNMAAGIVNKALSHKDVLETTALVNEKFKSFIKMIVPEL